jgi:hypothetical protein
MSKATKKAENAVNKAIQDVGKAGQAIIDNPLPIIETIAVTAALGPEGVGLASTVGAPASAAISSAAVSAANGGNISQIATAAASAGVGAEVTQLVAPEVGSSTIPGAATGSTNPLASAAGGAASGATQAALTGQDVGKAALTGGLVSGGAAAGAQGASSLLSPGEMSRTGFKAQPSVGNPLDTYGTGTSLDFVQPRATVLDPTTGQQIPVSNDLGASLSTKINQYGQSLIPTEGGLGLVGDPNAILPPSLLQYATAPGQYRAGSSGQLTPAYESGGSVISPPGYEEYALPGENQPAETLSAEPQYTPGLSKEAQDALQSVLGFGLNALLSPKASGSTRAGQAANTLATTGTTSSTTGGEPGGTELDPSTGKKPQLVWGDEYKSLKEGLNI